MTFRNFTRSKGIDQGSHVDLATGRSASHQPGESESDSQAGQQPQNFGAQVRALAQAPNRTGGIGKQVSALAQARNSARQRIPSGARDRKPRQTANMG